ERYRHAGQDHQGHRCLRIGRREGGVGHRDPADLRHRREGGLFPDRLLRSDRGCYPRRGRQGLPQRHQGPGAQSGVGHRAAGGPPRRHRRRDGGRALRDHGRRPGDADGGRRPVPAPDGQPGHPCRRGGEDPGAGPRGEPDRRHAPTRGGRGPGGEGGDRPRTDDRGAGDGGARPRRAPPGRPACRGRRRRARSRAGRRGAAPGRGGRAPEKGPRRRGGRAHQRAGRADRAGYRNRPPRGGPDQRGGRGRHREVM
ncbi:MAG: hypothetical protein AVDCRST_MAG19-1681, partial [uncultured Thermomicrobiales bacterium]